MGGSFYTGWTTKTRGLRLGAFYVRKLSKSYMLLIGTLFATIGFTSVRLAKFPTSRAIYTYLGGHNHFKKTRNITTEKKYTTTSKYFFYVLL